MAPVVDRLAAEYAGDVEIRKMNVETDDGAASLASRLRVEYVPTFVFVQADGTVAATIVGETTEADLREALDALQ